MDDDVICEDNLVEVIEEQEEQPKEGEVVYEYEVGDIITISTDGGFFKLDSDFIVHGECILIKPNNLVFQILWNHGNIIKQLIICDLENHSILGVYSVQNSVVKAKVDLSEIKEDQEINLNDKIWKGQVLNEKPYGWGELFTNNGNIEYTGFMVESNRVCYGTIYHWNEDLQYSGTIYNNIPFGACTIFAGTKCVYDGGIINGDYKYSGILQIPSNTQIAHHFNSLIEEIHIGKNCYLDMFIFSISGFTFLRKLEIDDNSFHRRNTNLNNRNDDTYKAYIMNCPNLEVISIGADCFVEFCVCELRGLPALRSLTIGTNENHIGCFVKCFELILEDLPKLTEFKVGKNVFSQLYYFTMRNLPSLISIIVGVDSLCGDDSKESKESSQPPFDYSNCVELVSTPFLPSFILIDLPSLKLFQGNGNNFTRFGHLRVINVPIHHVIALQLQSTAFSDVIDLGVEESPLFDDWLYSHTAIVPFSNEYEFLHLETTVQNIILQENIMNNPSITHFDVSQFTSLEILHIKSYSFCYVTSVIIESLPTLHCVIIEDWCFTGKQDHSSCFIQLCPQLQEIDIGVHSMNSFTLFSLMNLDSLQVLHIEKDCFCECKSFSLQNMKSLSYITIGEASFHKAFSFNLTNLPKLQMMVIKNNSFNGYISVLSDFSQFVLKNLNQLISFFAQNCFQHCQNVRIENVKLLKPTKFNCKNCFLGVLSKHLENCQIDPESIVINGNTLKEENPSSKKSSW